MFDGKNSGFCLENFVIYSFNGMKTTHFIDVVNLIDVTLNGVRYPNIQCKYAAHSENAADNPKESYSTFNWTPIK